MLLRVRNNYPFPNGGISMYFQDKLKDNFPKIERIYSLVK